MAPPGEPGDGVDVIDIVVDRAGGLTVEFADGYTARLGLEELRTGCPCATCRGWRDRGEPAWPRPGAQAELRIVDADLIGAWGISFRWNDGHDTGIYPWDALRRWCEEDFGGESP